MRYLIIRDPLFILLMVATLCLTGCQTAYAQTDLVAIPTLVTPISVAETNTPPLLGTPEVEPSPVPPTETLEVLLTPYPDEGEFTIGQSVEGRDVDAWRFKGSDTPTASIVLVGGIHGGYEANTIALSEQLIAYFRINPEDILPEIELVIIPNANPDGLATGRNLQGRFNANGVDLNRNWGCDWSETAYLGQSSVNPGPRPFSEPESVALRQFFIAEEPDAVLFYHSSLGGIFLGECGGGEAAEWLGDLLSESTGYPHYDDFTFYEVTGDASNWLAERDIPAAIIELYSKDDAEFDENFAGVMALQCHFAEPGSEAHYRLCFGL